jgi:Rrf2 family protein
MISKSALYALRAAVELAQLPAGTFATASHVAEACGAPAKYLSKVLEILISRGLVRSQKGLHGGYALARSAETIRLLDIIDPIDQVSRVPECLLGRAQCSDTDPCPAHERWRQVRGALTQMLATTTLAELLPKQPRLRVSAKTQTPS